MNLLRLFPRGSALLALLLFSPVIAAGESTPPAPSEDALRSAATRGLAFLAREGDRWMDEKTCLGCHHLPLLLWSHREAVQRGLPVDQARFSEWQEWAASHAPSTAAGLEQVALMILAQPEKPAEPLVKMIAGEQQADGSWKPAGQFAGMQARGSVDATFSSAHLFLLALGAAKDSASIASAAQAKAAPFLQKEFTHKSADSLVWQLRYARQRGATAEAETILQSLLRHQRGDGGWSWTIGENQSDALATGTVVQALSPPFPATPPAEAALARARAWLLSHQQADGGWAVDITHISKQDRSAPEKAKSFAAATEIYHYWGSAWATLGLVQSLPLNQP